MTIWVGGRWPKRTGSKESTSRATTFMFITGTDMLGDKKNDYYQPRCMAQKGHDLVAKLKALSLSCFGIPHGSPFSVL